MSSEFTSQLVLRAYAAGIFPMADDDGTIRWYSPDPRCIFDLKRFHVPKRMLRTYRQGLFEMRVNTAWDDVIRLCAARDSTWISEDIKRVYTDLYRQGYAHSIEVFQNDELAGGLYGVSVGGAFMAESMFHTVTDASKMCLVYTVERLRERGFLLLDTQYKTPHLSTFGAVNISRQEYLTRLQQALLLDCRFD